jgi:hypothetical protein
LTLSSPTAGASIGYRVKGSEESSWSLYSRPIRVAPEETVVVKACRIGFRESPAVELSAQSAVSPPAGPIDATGGDWRPQVINKDVLTRLLALKELDRNPRQAQSANLRALNDDHAAVRYWGVMGLRTAGRQNPPGDEAKLAIARLAERDKSEAVRIVAAHTLCQWNEQETGLRVLAAGLESHQRAVQLHAAHALEALGEAARPLLPRLKQLAAKSSEYVQRVTAHTVSQLERTGR